MGTSTEFMLLYGIKHHTWDENWYNTLEKYNSSLIHPAVDDFYKWAVMDYMCGEYFYLGRIVGKSADARWDLPEMDVTLNLRDLPLIKEGYIIEFNKQFPDFHHLIDGDWNIHAFTHFS